MGLRSAWKWDYSQFPESLSSQIKLALIRGYGFISKRIMESVKFRRTNVNNPSHHSHRLQPDQPKRKKEHPGGRRQAVRWGKILCGQNQDNLLLERPKEAAIWFFKNIYHNPMTLVWSCPSSALFSFKINHCFNTSWLPVLHQQLYVMLTKYWQTFSPRHLPKQAWDTMKLLSHDTKFE